ncbi:unnamed protein product [Nesidiocoris tenuis]|uniref:Uncharacterized protein n=1 Tax=Nesidiocoris tenuis TaxID=355587 RepID=A0A6H5HDT0_9HEMI|nr:unnamed protein product [Nesidiocoris tenuis]
MNQHERTCRCSMGSSRASALLNRAARLIRADFWRVRHNISAYGSAYSGTMACRAAQAITTSLTDGRCCALSEQLYIISYY